MTVGTGMPYSHRRPKPSLFAAASQISVIIECSVYMIYVLFALFVIIIMFDVCLYPLFCCCVYLMILPRPRRCADEA